MKLKSIFFLIILAVSITASAQVSVLKTIGKNASNYKLGWGLFLYYDIPLNDVHNQSLMLELLDFGYFATKDKTVAFSKGYASIKAGYRYIFSAESSTGFYVEPQAGYVRGVYAADPDAVYKDGIALAMEAGYTLEVGERGNHLNFGLKYENDLPGNALNIQAIGLRFSYSFGLFKRR